MHYIYHAEVYLFQEQLDSFLESAQKLKIEGLLGHENLPKDQETPVKNKGEAEEKTVFQAADVKQLMGLNDNII